MEWVTLKMSLVRMPRYSSNLYNNQRQFVRMMSRLLCLILAAVMVSGCATTAEDREQRRREQSAQQLYSAARQSMEVGNWKSAIEKLENLDSRYPFGPFSQQAQLDLIYSYYQNRDILERDVFQPGLLRAFGWEIVQVFTKDWLENADGVIDSILRRMEPAST